MLPSTFLVLYWVLWEKREGRTTWLTHTETLGFKSRISSCLRTKAKEASWTPSWRKGICKVYTQWVHSFCMELFTPQLHTELAPILSCKIVCKLSKIKFIQCKTEFANVTCHNRAVTLVVWVIATKDQFDLVYVCDHAIMLLRGECTSHGFFTKPRGNLMFVSLTIGCFVAWSTMEQLTCPIVLISIIPHTDRWALYLVIYFVSLLCLPVWQQGFAVFCCEQFFDAGVQEFLFAAKVDQS